MSLLWSILSFFLSSVARDAVNPRSSTASMMSRGPVISVSYTNRPLLVAKATEACKIPGLLIMEDSIRCTQEEHVIPLIWSKNEKIKIWIVSFKITHHYMSYYTVLYYTIPYHRHTPYHTIVIPYHTISYTIPYHIPYHSDTIPYHTKPFHSIPYHTIPYMYHTIVYSVKYSVV